MVAIAEKSNAAATASDGRSQKMKEEHNHQTARIIQWLGGERAGTVPKHKSIIIDLLAG